jgi:arylsulfatase A-like enzyme
MNMSRGAWRSHLAGLPLALALCLAFLLVSAGQIVGEFAKLAPHWGDLTETVNLRVWGSPLGRAVIFFIAAQLMLHGGLALCVWLLARVTSRAWPAMSARPQILVLLWFGILAAWILIGNATDYPWSRTGMHAGLLVNPALGDARLFDFLTLFLLASILWVCARAAMTVPRMRAAMPRTLAYGSVVALVLLTVQLVRANHERSYVASSRPNVILIGIDSLRADTIGESRGLGITPNIDAFLRDGAHLFADAVTPAARTYPSWVSILTGNNPRTHGARENLMPRSRLAPLNTLPMRLRAAGYGSLYSTDDVRFSNIDASYGFDRDITPSIGATDFLLSKANDLPLPNLISNTRLGRWLFPATYANRAAYHAYRPDTYIEWLQDEVEPGGPRMLAFHLTLPHWPFTWAERGDKVFERSEDRPYQYATSVIAADRQFGQLLALLESRGLLENAVVAVFSDHGEALGMPVTDALVRAAAAREVLGTGLPISMWGHGNSVMSPSQYQVVLAFRGYGKAAFAATSRVHSTPASVIDIAPTMLDLVGVPPGGSFEGRSLRPIIEGDTNADGPLSTRARFTETGFRTPMLKSGNFDEHGLLQTMAPFFRMDDATARFEVRLDRIPRLLADKERAAITRRWLLAAIPRSLEATTHIYVLFDRRNKTATRLREAPGADAEPEVRQLWDDMHAYYGDELLPPEK